MDDRDGTLLVHCQAGCPQDAVIAALREDGLWPSARSGASQPRGAGRRQAQGGRGTRPSPKRIKHSNTGAGLTLAQYAAAKQLPAAFLAGLGLADFYYDGKAGLRIPYLGADGAEAAMRFRTALEKGDSDGRFKWRKGSKPLLYGLWRLADAQQAGYIVLVEGESDAHTLWHQGVPALGIPGADTWREDWAAHLAPFERVYVVVEPDAGGAAVERWLGRSAIRVRAHLLDLGAHKDPSALYLADPAQFRARWKAAIAAARPWTSVDAEERQAAAREQEALAHELLHDPDLLGRVGRTMTARGYAGDTLPPRLGYVALTSRLLQRPQNLAYVAPSAAGKNRALDAALDLVPPEAVYIEKAGSARALLYNDEDFQHRTVVVSEADSIPEDGPAAAAIRALAQDNSMEYDVVEKSPESGHFETRRVRKPGPTGLLTTSTRSLGAQLGTRLLEVPVSDDEAQTRAVLRAHAQRARPPSVAPPDVMPYHALQRWLALAGVRDVEVPYAEVLADLVPATAVRMRRDFVQLLTCVQAIALLYQRQRERGPEGWIIATIDDYAEARALLAPLFDTLSAEGATPALRETVGAIAEGEEITEAELAQRLKLSKSTVSWRVRRAIKAGWLVNNEARRGHAARLARGGPLPEATSALPDPKQVWEVFECSSLHRDDASPAPSPLRHGALAAVTAAEVYEWRG